jgi:hypothetical protein
MTSKRSHKRRLCRTAGDSFGSRMSFALGVHQPPSTRAGRRMPGSLAREHRTARTAPEPAFRSNDTDWTRAVAVRVHSPTASGSCEGGAPSSRRALLRELRLPPAVRSSAVGPLPIEPGRSPARSAGSETHLPSWRCLDGTRPRPHRNNVLSVKSRVPAGWQRANGGWGDGLEASPPSPLTSALRPLESGHDGRHRRLQVEHGPGFQLEELAERQGDLQLELGGGVGVRDPHHRHPA